MTQIFILSIYGSAVCPKSCFAKILLILQGNIAFFTSPKN